MSSPLIDAYDLLVHAEQIELRLGATVRALADRRDLDVEREWLETARQRLSDARGETFDLLTRVVRLPELAPLRAERGRLLQGLAAAAVERLEQSVRHAGGERSPVLEALFRNMRLVLLRRFDRAGFEAFSDEIEKRIGSGYVTRMLADASYAPVAPVRDALLRALADWRSVWTEPASDGTEAATLRRRLEEAARRVDRPLRQARWLAEAALVSDRELLDSSGLLDKPKRRAARTVRSDDVEPDVVEPDAAEPFDEARS